MISPGGAVALRTEAQSIKPPWLSDVGAFAAAASCDSTGIGRSIRPAAEATAVVAVYEFALRLARSIPIPNSALFLCHWRLLRTSCGCTEVTCNGCCCCLVRPYRSQYQASKSCVCVHAMSCLYNFVPRANLIRSWRLRYQFIPYCRKGKSHQIVLFVRMIARFISVYRGVSWRMKRSMPSWTGVSSTAQRRTHDGALVRSRHHPSIRVSVRKAYLPSCFRPVRGRVLVVAFAAEHVHCREVQFGSTFPSIALAFMQPLSLVNAGRRRFALKSVRIRAALLSQAIPEWSGDCLTFAELEEPLDDTCTFILLLSTC